MPSFKLVNSWFDQSYSEVLEFKNAPPDSTTLRRYFATNISLSFIIIKKTRFTETLVGIRRRHADVVPTLAQVNSLFYE